MLIIITSEGEYQTKDSKQSILDQIKFNCNDGCDETIKFRGPVSSIPLENGLNSCDEEIQLDLNEVKILGFKEYVNIEKITTPIELKKLRERISEDTERADALEKAIADPEYQAIQELEKSIKEAKRNYSIKVKEEAIKKDEADKVQEEK